MNALRLLLAVLLVTATTPADSGEVPLDGTPLASMAGFIGNWEINTTWADGNSLWARNEFSVGLGGRFVEIRTFTDDGDGVYERYFTIYAGDPTTGDIKAYGFTFDGTTAVVDDVTIEGDVTDAAIIGQWGEGAAAVRQIIRLVSEDEYNWKVWMGGEGAWELIMDGNYQRVD